MRFPLFSGAQELAFLSSSPSSSAACLPDHPLPAPPSQSSSDVPDSRAKAVAAYCTFQSSLAVLAKASDDFNAKALAPDAQFPHNFGVWALNPKFLEVSVSV
jgi:hypothetical protein